jgi:hypothetical protein
MVTGNTAKSIPLFIDNQKGITVKQFKATGKF